MSARASALLVLTLAGCAASPPPPPIGPAPVEAPPPANAGASVAFEPGAGYVVRHRGATTTLPSVWTAGIEGRRDLTVSEDGTRVGVPSAELQPDEGMAIAIYDVATKSLVKRVALAKKHTPKRGTYDSAVSADGKLVEWTFEKKPCMVTEIATGTLDVEASKNGRCKDIGRRAPPAP